MSFGDPNNPWGPPPQQPPQQPPQPPQQPYQQPMGQPGYGYGYPQQPMYPGYPGGTMMAPVMPGLVTTARVLLFIIAAGQVLVGILMVFAAATLNDASNAADDAFADNDFADLGHASAAILLLVGLVFLALTALSITLGVKFSRGAQGVRITTMVYGILGGAFGVYALVAALDAHSSVALVSALLWISFGGVIAAAMITQRGAAWFNRARY